MSVVIPSFFNAAVCYVAWKWEFFPRVCDDICPPHSPKYTRKMHCVKELVLTCWRCVHWKIVSIIMTVRLTKTNLKDKAEEEKENGLKYLTAIFHKCLCHRILNMD